jgi:hypothetical protein
VYINPINNYGVNINIGDYVSFSEKNTKEKRILDLDYYVLGRIIWQRPRTIKDVPRMLNAFEHWFGPYPL